MFLRFIIDVILYSIRIGRRWLSDGDFASENEIIIISLLPGDLLTSNARQLKDRMLKLFRYHCYCSMQDLLNGIFRTVQPVSLSIVPECLVLILKQKVALLRTKNQHYSQRRRQWRIQNVLKGGPKTTYQPCCHLLQMHNELYAFYTRKSTY